MPSAPTPPPARQSAARPAARREFESYDQTDAGFVTLAASTAFQEVVTFGGRADSITIEATAVPIDVRFRHRGEAAGAPVRILATGEKRFQIAAEIVEARDPTGAGGQVVTAVGRFANRHIDVRTSRAGPLREETMLPASSLADRVSSTE